MRASEADRESVAGALRQHLLAGRITMEEFEARLAGAYGAVMLEELKELMADLPEAGLVEAAPAQREPERWVA